MRPLVFNSVLDTDFSSKYFNVIEINGIHVTFTDRDSFQYLCTDLVLIQLFYKDIYHHLLISFIFTDGNSSQ